MFKKYLKIIFVDFILYWLILLIVVIFVLQQKDDNDEILENLGKVYGVILKKEYCFGDDQCLFFEYYIEGKRYESSEVFNVKDFKFYGKKFLVEYSVKNPQKCRILINGTYYPKNKIHW